jgi:hypothetical protein
MKWILLGVVAGKLAESADAAWEGMQSSILANAPVNLKP